MNMMWRERSELNIWNEKNAPLTLEDCREVFEKDPDAVLYIENVKNQLLGIVTLGNVCRNIMEPEKWVTHRFIKIMASNNQKQDAERLLSTNSNIRNIPIVLNEKVIGDYTWINKSENISLAEYKDLKKIKRFLIYIQEHYTDVIWMESTLKYLPAEYRDMSVGICTTYENLFEEIKQVKEMGVIIEGEVETFKRQRIEVVTRYLKSKYKTLAQIWNDFEKYDNDIFAKWKRILTEKKSMEEIFQRMNISKIYYTGMTLSEQNICNIIAQQLNSIEWCQGIPDDWNDTEVLIYGTDSLDWRQDSMDGLLQRSIIWLMSVMKMIATEEPEMLVETLSALKKEEKIEAIFAEIPQLSMVYLNSSDRERLKDKNIEQHILQEPEKYKVFLKEFLGRDFDKKYFESIFTNTKTIEWKGYRRPVDYSDSYKTVINGRRVTCYQPKTYQNTIWIVGACTVFGHYVTDEDTIASRIQKKIGGCNSTFRVVNCGVPALIMSEMCKLIRDIEYEAGDIVLIIFNYREGLEENCKNRGIEYLHLSTLFQEEIGGWLLDSTAHISYKANNIIAQYLVDELNAHLNTQKRISGITRKNVDRKKSKRRNIGKCENKLLCK